jgi:RNA polymerase sigma-70 factor, ECF subfamily
LRSVPGNDILAAFVRERGVEFFSFDDAYLQRLRNRDFQTEQHFVAYFSKLILIKLRSRMCSSDALEDVRQETFVRVFKALGAEGGIRSGERLGGFVNSVCNNVLQEFYRASARDQPGDHEVRDAPDKTIDLDGMLASNQTRERVREVLGRLPEKDRQLLKALFIEDKEKDDICKDFGVNRDYLRVLLHRAKQSFRATYEASRRERRTRVEC